MIWYLLSLRSNWKVIRQNVLKFTFSINRLVDNWSLSLASSLPETDIVSLISNRFYLLNETAACFSTWFLSDPDPSETILKRAITDKEIFVTLSYLNFPKSFCVSRTSPRSIRASTFCCLLSTDLGVGKFLFLASIHLSADILVISCGNGTL